MEREIDGDNATQAGDIAEVSGDILGGFVGGGVGYRAKAMLSARINMPEYFMALKRNIHRLKRVAGNSSRTARQTARLKQVRSEQEAYDLLSNWWQLSRIQWPAAIARTATKAGTKEFVTVTIRYYTK